MLTFEQIAPKWAGVLLEGKPIPTFINYKGEEKPIDIVNGTSCVVGEAYGFSTKYIDGNEKCDICMDIAERFVLAVVHKPELRQPYIDEFTKHWNEVHAV